jgi:hypothetical protein
LLDQYKSTNTNAFSGWQEAERKVLAGELVKRQIEGQNVAAERHKTDAAD